MNQEIAVTLSNENEVKNCKLMSKPNEIPTIEYREENNFFTRAHIVEAGEIHIKCVVYITEQADGSCALLGVKAPPKQILRHYPGRCCTYSLKMKQSNMTDFQ